MSYRQGNGKSCFVPGRPELDEGKGRVSAGCFLCEEHATQGSSQYNDDSMADKGQINRSGK